MEVHLSDWKPVLCHRGVRVHGKIIKQSESRYLIRPDEACGSKFESEDIVKYISHNFIIDKKLQLIILTGQLTPTEDLPEFIRQEFQNGFPIYWYRLICMWIDFKLENRTNIYNFTEPLKLLSLSSLKRNISNKKNDQSAENDSKLESSTMKQKVIYSVNFPYTQSKTIQKKNGISFNYKLATLKNSSVVTSTPIVAVKGSSRFTFNEITKKKKALTANSFDEILDEELSKLSNNYRKFTLNESLSQSNTTNNKNTNDDDNNASNQSCSMVLRKRKHHSSSRSPSITVSSPESSKRLKLNNKLTSSNEEAKEQPSLDEKQRLKRKTSPVTKTNKLIETTTVQNNKNDGINFAFKKPLRPAPKSKQIFKRPEPKIDESVNNSTSSTTGTDTTTSTINETSSRKEKRKLFHTQSHQQNCTTVTF